MKYHALLFLKKQQNLKLLSASNYRWRFMNKINNNIMSDRDTSLIAQNRWGIQVFSIKKL